MVIVLLLVNVDTAVLNCVSAINQRLVLRDVSIKAGTRRCLQRLFPGIGWRVRDWLLRIEHKVLMQIGVAVVVVRDRILILRQRLLVRGVGKPCLLLVIRGERRVVGRENVGKGTWATQSAAEVQRP